MKKLRVKVLSVETGESGYCHECGQKGEIVRGVTKWTELTPVEYAKLASAVMEANQHRPSSDWQVLRKQPHYFIVQDLGEDHSEIFESAAKFTQWMEKLRGQQKRREAKEKLERQRKTAERKKRQLERLKKELELQ